MEISVIVPAYNSESTIKPCLDGIHQSTYKNFELIVVNDGSVDNTALLANQSRCAVIQHERNRGMMQARFSGARQAKGEILVFIDSDVIIQPDTLEKIAARFTQDVKVDALTGLLSKNNPYKNFFSQYKNLYMNYIFKKLPRKVSFLYGSIFAVRKLLLENIDFGLEYTEDTAMGQALTERGRRIEFIKDLEVTHLKKYDFWSWLRNDFFIPYEWAQIFMKFKGWKQLGKDGTGFAHASKEQILSLILALPIFLAFALALVDLLSLYLGTGFLFLWIGLNYQFLNFLRKERGFLFMIKSVTITYVDHLIMTGGIFCGTIKQIFPLR